MRITLYYNGACSTCRNARSLLEEKGAEVDLVHYLETPLDADALRDLAAAVGRSPHGLIRTKEALYQEKYAGAERSDEEWLAILAAHPRLLTRPIARRGGRAIIARPAETVVDILSDEDRPTP